MHILKTRPDVTEVIVQRVEPRRYAETRGEYGAFFKGDNDRFAAEISRTSR